MLIVDNFLLEDTFNNLQKFVLSNEFPWFYSSYVSLPPNEYEIEDEYAKETNGFYHLLYAKDENYHGYFMKDFQPFFDKLTEKFGYNQDHLIRARLGLKIPRAGHTKENYNLPHVDYQFAHDTVIFYLNDSDGNTRMFEEHLETHFENKKFTVKHEIEPKANRLLLFDGKQYHTASNPIESERRIVLNINLFPR